MGCGAPNDGSLLHPFICIFPLTYLLLGVEKSKFFHKLFLLKRERLPFARSCPTDLQDLPALLHILAVLTACSSPNYAKLRIACTRLPLAYCLLCWGGGAHCNRAACSTPSDGPLLFPFMTMQARGDQAWNPKLTAAPPWEGNILMGHDTFGRFRTSPRGVLAVALGEF